MNLIIAFELLLTSRACYIGERRAALPALQAVPAGSLTPRKVIHKYLWKSLWKTPLFDSQIFEFYGLLALCTYFVQILFTAKVELFLHLQPKHSVLRGFFKTFFKNGNVQLPACAKLFKIHQKNRSERGRMAHGLLAGREIFSRSPARISVHLFLQNLAEAVAEIVGGLQHLARF